MQESANPVRLMWPPPGLEGCQGILWRKAGELGLGSSILVFPFLFATSWAPAFGSLGFFGDAWWLLGVTSSVGFLIILRALVGIFGFFRKAAQAATHGIDLETALQVGADHRGDTGALLQGTREYYSLDETDRKRAVQARTLSSILLLSSAAWISAGWIVAFLLASRDLLGPVGAWLLTLGPTAATLLAGVAAMAYEGTILNSARGPFFWNRWKNVGRENAAQLWGEELRELRSARGEPFIPGRAASLVGMLSVGAFAAVTFIPTASLTVATSTGPVLAKMAVPKFSTTQRRAAAARSLERFRIPSDSRISPLEAGEALHILASVGRTGPEHEWFKPPVRVLEKSFIPREAQEVVGVMPAKWPTELFPMAAGGLPPEAEAFLRQVAEHPGLTLFETLGRAEAIDVMGGRFDLPLPETATALDIPIPKLSQVREAAHAMVAKSVVQFLDGDLEASELTLRTLISAGIVYGDEAPFLIDALIGYVLAGYGADALQGFYNASGKLVEADALQWVRESTDAMGKATHSFGPSASDAFQQMPARILNEAELRGIRWEYFSLLSGMSPCLNPHQAVFGPGASQEEFMRSARKALVRYPSEAAVWEVMRGGFFHIPEPGGWDGLAAKVMGATLGPRAGMCASVLVSPYL